MNLFKTLISLSLVAILVSSASAKSHGDKLYSGAPIKALVITGGCCHNYHFQTGAMTEGISKVADVDWTILNQGGSGKDYELEFYDDPNWAKPFDLVIHNECFAQTVDEDYVRKITRGHLIGVPAMVIHCAMHTYREIKADDWREFLGVTSRKHDHQSNYVVKNAGTRHPAIKGFPATWTTPMDELYVIDKLWPGATALATSVSEKDGNEYPVVWANNFRGVKVFGTTYGHSDATFQDPVFIQMLARGFLWAAGKE